MNNMNVPWWEITNITRAATGRSTVEQIAVLSMMSVALKNNICVYDHSQDGNLLVSVEHFLKEISELGGQVVSRSLNEIRGNTINTSDHIFVWQDAILTVSFEDNNWVYLKASSLNKDLILSIKEISTHYITHKTQGKAYVFVAGDHGPELRQISGKAGIELERENYTEKVLNDFDHIVKDLQSDNPCAKLIIADGEPGTGKTYLVRGLTNAVNGATFVLVQPSMISDIMSPQFIPVLMDHHKDGPIVFIVEDADSCLVRREGDNMNSISSLLNLGAGIFGDLFDIRVIATTNSRRIDMDPAIVRKGRCCRHLNIGALPKEHAERIFHRLAEDKSRKLNGHDVVYTLADIYYQVKNEEGASEKKKIIAGFAM